MTTRIFALLLVFSAIMLAVTGAAVLLAQAAPHDQWNVMAYTSLNGGTREIALTDLSHRLTYAVTAFDSLVDAPDWSPDGRKIAFHSSHETGYKVYVYDLFDGSLTKFNASMNSFDQFPTWSPDGTRLAFLVDDLEQSGNQVWIAALNAPDAPEKVTDEAGFKSAVSWSADGESITFHNAGPGMLRSVVFVDLNDRAEARTTRLNTGNTLTGWPQWSPEGERLLFLAEQTGQRDIIVMDTGGEKPTFRQITQNQTLIYDPQWSRDGASIAFLTGSDELFSGFYDYVYTVDVESGEVQLLYQPEGLIASPSWRP